jgi:hypothetical protein
MHTFNEAADSHPLRRLGQIAQSHIRLSFTDHKVDHKQRLEDDHPVRVPQPKLQSPEDLTDTRLSPICGGQDGYDVFRFGSGQLSKHVSRAKALPLRTLTLSFLFVAFFTIFSIAASCPRLCPRLFRQVKVSQVRVGDRSRSESVRCLETRDEGDRAVVVDQGKVGRSRMLGCHALSRRHVGQDWLGGSQPQVHSRRR